MEHSHKADLYGALFVSVYFLFHGNFLPKDKECQQHPLNRLIRSFFSFSVLPSFLPKASLGKPEQKVAGTWPVCLPRRALSQKEGAPH